MKLIKAQFRTCPSIELKDRKNRLTIGASMRVERAMWKSLTGWETSAETVVPGQLKDAKLVIFYTSTEIFEKGEAIDQLKSLYPQAEIVGCSDEGEVIGTRIYDDSLVLLAIAFDRPSSNVKAFQVKVENEKDSREAGAFLVSQLPRDNLNHVYLLTNAFKVDAHELIEGAAPLLPPSIGITGMVAADYLKFEKTYVYFNGEKHENSAIAVGFYGPELHVHYGCESGWKPYGPQRTVTKCKDGRILYEMDHKPALNIYKNFLGPYENRLPAIALNYPLFLGNQIRTIIKVDEEDQSVTLTAGGLPEGGKFQFMITNMNKIIEGAERAAQEVIKQVKNKKDNVILLNSCATRRQVLAQRTEEEVEAVDSIFNEKNKIVFGCYTYGEICPSVFEERTYLQNQTMTISVIVED